MIHVIAIITTKPGMREAFLKAAHTNIPNVLAEPGCIEYGAATDAEDLGDFHTKFGPDVLVFVEKWQSREALLAHLTAPHMAEYAAKTKDWVADRIIHVLSPG
jgi:quinol monooxygenase YgiN